MKHAKAAVNTGNRVATFWCDATPPLGTPIYSSYKPLAVVEFPLLAKGVVLEDANGRYVLCALDWCELRNGTYDLFRKRIAEAAQVDASRVAVQCVHQHTAPIADEGVSKLVETVPNPPPYPAAGVFEQAAQRVADAVKKSLEALTPYDQLGTGQAKVERVASNRRVPIGEGKVGFRGSSCKEAKLIEAPEGLIDPMVKTISIFGGGRPLARLHYYTTHPQSYYGDPRASYDFVGMARERMQEKEGVFQVYFTGCAGNVAAGKYNDGAPEARQGLFERLFAGIEASVASTQRAPAAALEWRTVPVVFEGRNDAGFTETDGRTELTNTQLPADSRIGGAMTLAWRARSHEPIELSALTMDKVRILHLPGEPAVEYQLFAQELRPGQFVAVAGYGECACGYICLERFYAEGGYEPTSSNIVPQSEKVFRDGIRNLLDV